MKTAEYVFTYFKSEKEDGEQVYFAVSKDGLFWTEINAGKPMIIRMGWNAGGGHAIVGAGYSDSSIYAIDPWENTSNRYYAYTLLKNGGTIATGTGKATHAVLY